MTAAERNTIRAEYAELFGEANLALALRCRKSAAWMQDAVLNERVSRARCAAIRDQVVTPNRNLTRFVCNEERPMNATPTTNEIEIEEHIRKLNEELRTKPLGSPSREDREIAKDRWIRLLRAQQEAQR